MAECARTIVKTICFQRFHFFNVFRNLVPRGMDLGYILVSFGDPGGTFSDFEGLRDRFEI